MTNEDIYYCIDCVKVDVYSTLTWLLLAVVLLLLVLLALLWVNGRRHNR
jgi:hypothetical protein